MAKPTIVTRAGKGSALTWTEGDANLTNLQNATIGITDGTTSGTLDLNDTLTFTAGTNITISYNSTSKSLTINSTASGGDVVNDTTPQLGGNLDVNGYSIVSANNGNISIVPHGSGNIQLTPASGYVTISAVNFPTSTPSAGQVLYAINGSGSLGWTTPSSGGATTLDDLTDVNAASPTSGYYLAYQPKSGGGYEWAPADIYGIAITSDNTSNATRYPLFAQVTSGVQQGPMTDSGFTYNPSTGVLTATASDATNAANITQTVATNNANYYPLLSNSSTTGTRGAVFNTTISMNPNTGVVTANGFSGPINGTVGATTPNTGSFTTLSASSTFTANSNANFNNTTGAKLSIGTGAVSSIAWTTSGIGLRINSATYTDTNSVAGTVAASHIHAVAASTMASTNVITVTDAATLYIANQPTAGTNTTITNGWAILAGGKIKATGLENTPVGATTASTGKFTSLEFKNPLEPIYDLGTTGGTIAPDCANGSVQKITLNAALTINAFTNPTAGESLTLIIYGGTAYTSITSTMKFAGGIKTLTATAGCIDILTVYYDGTNYFASLGKGYA